MIYINMYCENGSVLKTVKALLTNTFKGDLIV